MRFRSLMVLTVLVFLCLHLSCGGGSDNPLADNNDNQNPNDATGNGFLQARIDGTTWEATSVGFFPVQNSPPIDELGILGTNDANLSLQVFSFRLVAENLKPGNFELISGDKVLGGEGVTGGFLSNLNYEFISGRFTLSTLSKTRVEGSFEGVLSDDAGNSMNVTEGRFDITIPD